MKRSGNWAPLMEPVKRILGGGGQTVVIPPPAPPPPAPSLADAQTNAARRAQEDADALARKRGRASTVKTGPEGVADTPISVKTLVGS